MGGDHRLLQVSTMFFVVKPSCGRLGFLLMCAYYASGLGNGHPFELSATA